MLQTERQSQKTTTATKPSNRRKDKGKDKISATSSVPRSVETGNHRQYPVQYKLSVAIPVADLLLI